MNSSFSKAKTIGDVLTLLDNHKDGCALIAGGTDLLVEIHKINLNPAHIIDIAGVEALRFLEELKNTIKIGPALTHSECIGDPVLNKYAPILTEACSHVGSPQIRNRGTIGGNIISAAACADTVPALIVLNGKCTLKSASGTRVLAISDLITGPNETVCRPNELCTEIEIEKIPEGARYSYIKLIRRNSVAKSRLTVAAVVRQNEKKEVTDIRISVGSSTPKPHRFTSAEDILLGSKPTEEKVIKAGETVAADMISVTGYRWSTEYKEPVVQKLTARALREILEI
jgi:CO/xanthine dehydrogenase FAD-binding subunit